MYRSVLASLTVVSLMLTVVPGSAQQRTPATAVTPQVQPAQVQQQDCPNVIAEVDAMCRTLSARRPGKRQRPADCHAEAGAQRRPEHASSTPTWYRRRRD